MDFPLVMPIQLTQNINFIISLVVIVFVFLCSLIILYSYFKLRLRPILLYFFGIFFLIFGSIGLTIGSLPLSKLFIKQIQSYLFTITWFGIYFLYLAIKSSKGDIFNFDTNIVSASIGAISLAYISQQFYDVQWDVIKQNWQMVFQPILTPFFLIIISFIIYELVSFARLVLSRTRQKKVKRNLIGFFMGWIIIGSTGLFFGVSLFIPETPTYVYLIVLSVGLSVISISVSLIPSSLIATTRKIYGIGFLQLPSGLVFMYYDLLSGEVIGSPELISGFVNAINVCLTESIRGCKYLKVIDAGPRKIIIERGYNAQAIMIVEKDTQIMKSILKKLLLLFEFQYFDLLSDKFIIPERFEGFKHTIEKYLAFAL